MLYVVSLLNQLPGYTYPRIDHYNIVLLVCRLDKKKLLSRCSQCNLANIAKVDKAAIQDVVDPKVFNHVTRFWQCQECKKVFWVGPKSDAAVQNMLSLVPDDQTSQQ